MTRLTADAVTKKNAFGHTSVSRSEEQNMNDVFNNILRKPR